MRHVAAYAFVAPRVRGLRVLDAGAGEGYGAALLARHARSVEAVDNAPEVVAHARAAYPGVRFSCAAVADLPLPTGGVDAVVALQVIEHLRDPRPALAEVARVLAPGGRLWVATPNRLTFPPGNPFHFREYAPGELVDVLSGPFDVQGLYGVHHGPRIAALELATRRAFADLVLARPPGAWPAWLRRAVAAVGPADFRVRVGGVARSLDLLAVAGNR
jgi:SAM-dependent methyltransferase